MKESFCALVCIGSLVLFNTGCKKQGGSEAAADPLQTSFQDLRAELVKASPQVQSNLYSHVDYSLRYENYLEAMMYLDVIANDPSLTEKQKKDTAHVIELMKAKVQAGPNANAPKPLQ